MSNFLKTFLAALLAIVVANILAVVFAVMVIAGIGASFADLSGSGTTIVESNSILKIDLSEQITDRPSANPIASIDFMTMKMHRELALIDVVNAIDRAAYDDRINGIYLNVNTMANPGMAATEEIRNALIRFKDSGKFIVSYADSYTQGSYYFSSVADQMYLNPEGNVMWLGMASGVMFYKDMLERLNIKTEIIRHGAFKSAVEPFMLDKMSPENRLQMNTLIGTIWGHIVKNVSESRSIDSALLQQYASELTLSSPESAVQTKMIDSLVYSNDVERMMQEMIGEDVDTKPNYISLSDYVSQPRVTAGKLSKNKVAVVYASGSIVDGEAQDGQIGGVNLAEKLAKVRRDSKVKAVVLRVNSPGGSALASEVIWHEMELLRQEKPVIVSMGNVAASGGYYISCPADAILASPVTITGSIGVFGLLFNAETTFKEKLGITIDVAKTNTSADMNLGVLGAMMRELTPQERAHIQNEVERIYTTFVNHVSVGRNLSYANVDSLGGGRVWSGASALENGLIDGHGGLQEAVDLAAERAGVSSDYRISVPEEKLDPFSQLFRMMAAQASSEIYKGELGEIYKEYEHLQFMLSQTGVQAIMPYTIRF